jgi:AcrR family transcriptional regulator
MVRITKEYDERLKELLDSAQQFFFEKGYQKTSVNDIIEKVGVAKGTFYHYFKTKSDLLDKLVERFTEVIHTEMKKLVKRTDLNALEKMNGFFALGRTFKARNIELMKLLLKALYNEENLVMRHRMIRNRIKLTLPEFVKVIDQGIKEDVFNVTNSRELAELIYYLGININELAGELLLTLSENPENINIIERKIKAYESSVEKILGIPEGSISIADRDFINMFRLEEEGKK